MALIAARDELVDTRAALVDLVPGLARHEPTPHLVAVVAAKLAGHRDCHRMWRPRTVAGAVEVIRLALSAMSDRDRRQVVDRLQREVAR